MTSPGASRTEYLEALREHLPVREASRVLAEVDGLIQDRVEAALEEPGVTAEAAERRALEALGSPETLAAQLVDAPLCIDLATRRTFLRLLGGTFAAHLVLSIVLTVAGEDAATIPGLLGPLRTQPWGAAISSLLAILLLDAGALFLLFAIFGRGKAPKGLPRLHLTAPVSRRDGVLGLLLLGLVALILHPLRDQVFAVHADGALVGFLSSDFVRILPVVDAALALFAVRQVLLIRSGRETPWSVGADALGTLVLAVGLLLAANRPQIVAFPSASLGSTAAVLEDLVTRVFLLVFVAAALFLAVRLVKRLFRLRQLMA